MSRQKRELDSDEAMCIRSGAIGRLGEGNQGYSRFICLLYKRQGAYFY